MLVVFIGLALSGLAFCIAKWGLTVVAQSTLGIFVMLAVLSALIIVHECGHYCVARFFGFQTPVFGFGLPFGPYWVMGHRWGTEFRFHACLLGGYVAIPELGDETNAKEENYGVPLQPFKKFPIWQRALVAFAGVGMNIVFAYFVILVMLTTIGEPVPAGQPYVSDLPKGNPIARDAGIKNGDVILAIGGQNMKTSEEIIGALEKHKSQQVIIKVERDGKQVDVPVTPNASGKIGMQLSLETQYVKPEGDFLTLVAKAGETCWKLTTNMIGALGMVFQGIFGMKAASGPSVGIGDVHGVMAVVKYGMDMFNADWHGIFLFTALISLDLAIINLVPWPALDGGHLMFMAVEAVRGRPMGERAQGEIVKWGFISLLLLMAVIMVNDVRALLKGELDFKMKKGKDQLQQENRAPSGGNPTQPASSEPAGSTSKPADATKQPTVTPTPTAEPTSSSTTPAATTPATTAPAPTPQSTAPAPTTQTKP
jgi:membrane-associated protease RseP (regulator of RpoE activity)